MLNDTIHSDLFVNCDYFNGSSLWYYGMPVYDLPAGESALVFEHENSNGTLYLYANGTVETHYHEWIVLNSWNDTDCNYTERQSYIQAYCKNNSMIYFNDYDDSYNDNETYIMREEYTENFVYIETWSNGTVFESRYNYGNT